MRRTAFHMHRSRQRGVALIEFALILPFLLLLSFITFEFGRALYQYNVLVKSARDSARYLSMQTPGPGPAIAVSKNLLIYGNLAGTGTPQVVGLAFDQAKEPEWALKGSDPVINTVTVRLAGCGTSPGAPCYKFTPLISSAFGLTFADINFADITATMRAPL